MKDAYGYWNIETYDHGYILTGKHGHNYVNYLWMIKTDINGEQVWEKTLGEPNSFITINHIDMNEAGEIFCAGSTNYYEPIKDPMIIKLNPCAEKEWCRIFYSPDNFDFSDYLIALDDGGCIAILRYTGDDPNGQEDRICLVKISGQGDLQWKQCYNSTDTCLINEEANHLLQTEDRGFLLSGYCYYMDPNNPNSFWLKPYFIKADSVGNFMWETVVHSDLGGELGGISFSSTLNPSKTHYFASISHYYTNPYESAPALIKLDMQGHVIDIYDIVEGYENGGLAHSTFLNDTIIAGSAGWGNTEEDIVNHAVLIDTLGNIIDYVDLVQDIYGSILQITYDTKLVYMYNTYQNEQFDVYLRKLNQSLEDDSLCSFLYQYDTLCPYPIASDTIPLDDCELIVGIEEPNVESPQEAESMIIYPNPASNIIHVRCSMDHVPGSILIYDLFGRKIEEITIPKGQDQIQINISSYPQGIYIAVLRDSKGIIARKKFVVAGP